MRALVLGGTGFVGMNVARCLVQKGHEVAATRRTRANTLFARKMGAKLLCAELDDVDSLEAAMQRQEVVFHCAGYYPRYSLDPNEQVRIARHATANVIEAARRARVQRLVLTSSVATVGPPRNASRLSDEQDPMSSDARDSVYFSVKEAIEQDVLAVRDLDTIVTCPAGILGELDVKAGTGFVIVALAHGLLPFYVQGKTNIIDADDMALAHLAAAERGRAGERYILGGHNLTIKDMLLAACEELGLRFFSWPMPLSIAGPLSTFDEMRCAARSRGERPFIPREFVDIVRHGQWVDSAKATRDLDLQPPTPLDLTLRKACAWYERFRYIPRRSRAGDASSKPAIPRIFAASSQAANQTAPLTASKSKASR